MPDQNRGDRNSDQSRGFEKLTKSVLETDHPVFGKIKKELPNYNLKSQKLHPALKLLKEWEVSYHLSQKAVIVFCSMILSFFIYRQITDPFLDYKLGDLAQRHLIAQKTMELVDEETTEAKRRSATEAVLAVYDYDRRVFIQTRKKIEKGFSILRRQFQPLITAAHKKGLSSADLAKLDIFAEGKKAFSNAIEADLTDAQFESLVATGYSQRVERGLVHLMAKVNVNLIVSSRESLKNESARGITLNFIGDDNQASSERTFSNIASVIDVESARSDIENDPDAKQMFSGPLAPYADRFIGIGKKMVVPNLTLNKQETEKRKLDALKDNKPVLMRINKGDSIVRYGETINKRHLAILKELEKVSQNDNSFSQFVFTTIFLSIFIFAAYSFLQGGINSFHYENKDFVLIALLMVSAITMVKGVQFVAVEALIEKFPQVPLDFYYYLIPVAAGPVIIRMLLDKEPAFLCAVVLSVVSGILLERNFFFAAYVLSSSLLAVSLTKNIKTRAVIYRTGLITGVLNVLMIACIMSNTRNAADIGRLWQDSTWIVICGMLSGIFISMIVMVLVPVAEFISGRTSDLRLLELANMNHPLLRDLMVKAPGTYHHCIVIGSLVEAAAEAIDANPLMCRVMAYYHDVGKMERPLYFIENQAGGYNRHDGLQPHMSAMIIRDHVKKGQELGRKFKLPRPIIDAMSEHHGSSTIWYFFNKARSQAEDPDSVLESDYKYDGQKPQSKETALVMLGDVVEAATRSVADPTPLRLSGVVKNILNKYFAEGQLSECDLTLRDLDLIAKSFLDVLLGIYHARIEYGVPSLKDNGKKRPNGNQDHKGNQRPGQPGGMGSAPSAAPYTKPYQVSGSGGGRSDKS